MSLQIDLKEWARANRHYEGHFPLAQMDRLKPHLHDAGASLKEESVLGKLQFGIDTEGWNFVRGRLDGALLLTCPRCLKGVGHAVALDFSLCLVQNEAEGALRPDHYDPLILKDFSGILEDIIEDELLLNVPIVMFHPWDECLLEEGAKEVLRGAAQKVTAGQRRPFGDLKKQLEKSNYSAVFGDSCQNS